MRFDRKDSNGLTLTGTDGGRTVGGGETIDGGGTTSSVVNDVTLSAAGGVVLKAAGDGASCDASEDVFGIIEMVNDPRGRDG